MKRALTSAMISLLALGGVLLGYPEFAFGEKVSLSKAIDYAISRNYTVKALEAKLNAQQATYQETKAAYYPTIGIVAGLDQRRSDDIDESFSLGYGYFNYNLFNGFKDFYGTDVARSGLERVRIELEQTKFVIRLAVEEKFHAYLYASEAIGLKQEAISINKDLMNLAKRTQAAGLTSKADTMAFSVKSARLQSEMVELEEDLDRARIGLKQLLGEEVGGGIEPTGALIHQHITGSLQVFVDEMKKRNPTLRLASIAEETSFLDRKIERGNWLPKVDLEVQMGYLGDDSPLEGDLQADDDTSVRLLLRANWELFSGFRTKAATDRALAKAEQAQFTTKQTILDQLTEVELSYLKLKAIEKRVHLEADNVNQTSSYYQAVSKEYERGYKNAPDLSDAMEQKIEARQRLLDFKYEFLMERTKLERLTGVPVPATTVDEDHLKTGK